MTAQKSSKGILVLLMYALLAGALWTYTQPMIRVHVPPLVSERWSPWEMTKDLPRALTQPKSQWGVKLDYDFMDVLWKLLPRDIQQEPKKLSLPFILGILVPVFLMLTYLIVIFGFLMVYAEKEGAMHFFSGLGVLISGYALAGTYYMAKAAEKAFRDSVAETSQQFLGAVTKNFVQKIVVEPDQGLYAIFFIMFLIYAVQSIRKN